MYDIARLPSEEREILFKNTAAKKGLPEAIIEKDFWVCFVLEYLFNRSMWKKQLAFKGGTSLSKAYDLIQRFSEDIDLMLDWRVLGYSYNEPWEDRSKTKQLKFNEDSIDRLFAFLSDFITEKGVKSMHIIMSDEDPVADKVSGKYKHIYKDLQV